MSGVKLNIWHNYTYNMQVFSCRLNEQPHAHLKIDTFRGTINEIIIYICKDRYDAEMVVLSEAMTMMPAALCHLVMMYARWSNGATCNWASWFTTMYDTGEKHHIWDLYDKSDIQEMSINVYYSPVRMSEAGELLKRICEQKGTPGSPCVFCGSNEEPGADGIAPKDRCRRCMTHAPDDFPMRNLMIKLHRRWGLDRGTCGLKVVSKNYYLKP